MIIFCREALEIPAPVSIELSPLEGEGRTDFLPLTWNRMDSAVLIHYDPKRVENTYYADIAAFLHEIGVPAPRVIRHDPARCLSSWKIWGSQISVLQGNPWKLGESFTKKR